MRPCTLANAICLKTIIVASLSFSSCFIFVSRADSDPHIAIAVVASCIPMSLLALSSTSCLSAIGTGIGVLVDCGYRLWLRTVSVNFPTSFLRNGGSGFQPAPERAHARYTKASTRRETNFGPLDQPFFVHWSFIGCFLPAGVLLRRRRNNVRPLAWTKTLAFGFSSVLAIKDLSLLRYGVCVSGHFLFSARDPKTGWSWNRRDSCRAISRVSGHLPTRMRLFADRKTHFAAQPVFLLVTLPLAAEIGSQFCRRLVEAPLLYMPTALPGIAITQASQLLQEQDRIIEPSRKSRPGGGGGGGYSAFA